MKNVNRFSFLSVFFIARKSAGQFRTVSLMAAAFMFFVTLPLSLSSCSQGEAENLLSVVEKGDSPVETGLLPAETEGNSASSGSPVSKYAKLSLSAESLPLSDESRTILPDYVDFSENGDYAFVLTGKWKSEEGETASVRNIATWITDSGWTSSSTDRQSAYQKMISDTSITVQTGLWDFYLDAKNTQCSNKTAFTKTLTDVTIKTGANTLSFGKMEEAEYDSSIQLTLEFPPEADGEVSYVEAVLQTLDGYDVGNAQTFSFSQFNTYEPDSAVVTQGGKTEGTRYISVIRNQVPCGTYRIFFNLYNSKGLLVKTARDLVRVASGRVSRGTVIVKKLNTVYKINYMGVNGSYNCVSGYTIGSNYIDSFNEFQTIELPSSEFKKGPYYAGGWYLSADFSGDSITGWLPGESPREDGATEATDVTLYPKWYTSGVDCADAISALKTAGEYTIRVKGALVTAYFADMATAIKALPNNVFVNLDFSEASLNSIPASAFLNCTKLKGITLPSTVITIGASAFEGCSALTAISIPAATTRIEDYAFNNCTSLKTLRFEDGDKLISLGCKSYNTSNGKGLFYDSPLTSLYLGRNTTYKTTIVSSPTAYSSRPYYYGYSAFAQNQNAITNKEDFIVEIGKYVTSIPMYLLYDCVSLKSVTIHPEANITSIGKSAFYNGKRLASFEIPSTVITIEDSAFSSCSFLSSITIPALTTRIGDYAFDNCTGLKTLRFEDGDESISLGCKSYNTSNGKGLFYDCPLTSLYLGRNTTYTTTMVDSPTVYSSRPYYYGYSAFAKNQNAITNKGDFIVEIGKYVSSIPMYLLYDCESLKSVTIHSEANITSIGKGAFYNGKRLASFEIPPTVTTIEDSVFSSCSSLSSITIPASTTRIGDYAFDNCTGLKTLRFEDGDKSISLGCKSYNSNNGKGLFYDCPLTSLYLGRNTTYKTTMVDSPSAYSSSSYYYYGYSAFAQNQNAITNKEDFIVEIGKYVSSIPMYLLYDCESLKSVTIHPEANITSIGKGAFYNGKRLASFEIPSTVTTVEDSVFSSCSSLSSITIPASTTRIGDYAFDNCTGLKTLRFEDGEASISLGCKSYNSNNGKGLFYDCPLTSLYLGRNTTYKTTMVDSPSAYSSRPYYYGYSAFANITSIQEVTVSPTVTNLGSYVLMGCTGVKKLILSEADSMENYAILSLGNNGTNAGLFSDFTLDEFYLGRTVGFSNKPFQKTSSTFAKIPKKITIGDNFEGIQQGLFHTELYTDWYSSPDIYPLTISGSGWYYTAVKDNYTNKSGGSEVPENLTDAEKKEYFITNNMNNYYFYRTVSE